MRTTRSRRVVAVVGLAIVLTLGLGLAAFAQVVGIRPGTWEIGIEPPGKPRRVVGYFALGCGSAFKPDGTWAGGGTDVGATFADGVYRGGTLAGFTAAWKEQFDVRLAGDGTTATGTWHNGYETLRTSWRHLPPRGVRIQSMSQTKDSVRIEVAGSKLFYYDRTFFERCGNVFVEGTGMAVTNATPHAKAESASITIAVAPGTPAGRRVLSVDGIKLPWDWRGDGTVAQAPTVSHLQFVRAVPDPRLPAFITFVEITDDIKYGERFHVEARFSAPPAEGQRWVRLDWSGGTPRDVQLEPTETEGLFRSGPLYLEAPPAASGPTR